MTVSIEGTTPGIAVDGTGAVVNVTVTTGDGGGGGGVTDHGLLTGLSDDDHTQYAKKASNLSDLASAATARTNLGLGTAAVEAASAFATAAQGVDARTPTAHKTSHENGGTDELALDASQITSGTIAQDRLGTGSAGAGEKFLADDQTYKTVTASETLAASIIDAKGDLIVGTANDTPARLAVGSDGQLLGPLASATPGVAHRWPNGPEVNVAYRTGKYYTAGAMLAGTRTLSANTLYYIPFPCMRTTTFDRIQSYCGASGHSIRMGIYESGSDGLPGALLLDAGAATAPGNFAALTITISQALVGGTLYWLGLVSDSAATVVKCSPIGSQAFGLAGAMDVGGNQAVISQSHTYGALPSNASGLSYTNSVELPAIGVRAS